jgi:protein-S-isoprenylcysteine O-methyltransferase Ste14
LGKIAVGLYAHTVIVGTLWTVLRRMKSEDDAMRRQFGKKWDAWARDVPYLILPGIY